jgi:ribosome-associated protein
MKSFKVKSPATHIDLCDLLKLTDLCDTGGEAKHVIAEGQVKVNGEVELRKRAKIKPPAKVEYKGQVIAVE